MKLKHTFLYLFLAFLCHGQEAITMPTYQLDGQGRPIRQLVNGEIQEEYEYLTKGQTEKITLQSKTALRTHSNFSYDYYKGDTILLSIKTKKDKILKRVKFFNGEKDMLLEATDIFEYEQNFFIAKDGKYTLDLYNNGFLSAIYSVITIERRPQSIIKVNKFNRDTSFQIDTLKKWVALDTQAILVLEEEITLPPMRNLEQSPYAIIELNLPVSIAPEARLLNWAFWVGTSQEEIEDYTFLSENMPAEWLFKEAPPVLGAYFLNKPVAMPNKKNSYVQLAMTTNSPIVTLQKNQFPKSIYTITNFNNFGKIRKAETPASGRIFICLKNTDGVNGYPVKLQVVAFQLTGEIQEQIQRKIEHVELSFEKSTVTSLNLK